MKYDVIIGMEIHAQLKTKSKMFCDSSNNGENKSPNTTICEVCTAQPGTLPVINKQAVEWTVLTGLALNCQIADESKFDRKNYFYPDLPKGYQISQYDKPISFDGYLIIDDNKIKIIRIHLEEDTGKLFHPQGVNYSLIDYNRAGTPLMELVTAPDIKSAEEAKRFCQEYQRILRYLDVSDADMEKGQMRCEANISLQEKGKWVKENDEIKPVGDYKLNPKIELKNINSFRGMERAVNYEIKRQARALADGEKLLQETRGWNDSTGKTYHQRLKESAHDYRYFPEPDLPPFNLIKIKEKLQNELPELPLEKEKKFREEYGFSIQNTTFIVSDKKLADYTEQVILKMKNWIETLTDIEGTQEEKWANNKKKVVKIVSGWIISKLGGIIKAQNISFEKLKITSDEFFEFLILIYQNKINTTSAQKILEIMVKSGRGLEEILAEGDFEQMNDTKGLEEIVEKVINSNPKAVGEYKGGKINAIQFLVGQIMKETKGKADPQSLRILLEEKLKKI